MKFLKDNSIFLLVSFCLLLAVILTYSNHWSNSFHFDDCHTILDNTSIRSLGNALSFFTDPRTATVLSKGHFSRPLCTLSAAIDYQLGHGYNPFYFHLSSFLWYLAQLLFMFWLFMAIFNYAFKHDWNKWLALFGVGWYGLHTANAETINYISARSDLLSTALVIIALVAYARSQFWRRSWLYLVPYILGVLAKQSALMFGPLLFVYLILFEEDSFLVALRKALPALVIAFLFVLPAMTFATYLKETTNIPYSSYLITQAFVALYFFKMFFWPVGLSADYDWAPLNSVLDPRFLLGSAFIIALLILAYYFSGVKKYRPMAFGLLWYILALLPTSLVPLTEVVNDHRMFFPFVGLTIAVCWLAGSLLYKYEQEIKAKPWLKIIIISTGLIILLANALGTRQRNQVWNSEESLWHDVTLKSPKNGRGLMNYGLTQMSQGHYDAALKYFQKAKEYVPRYGHLYINLGILMAAMNDQPAAEANFKLAIVYNPGFHGSYYFYARWLNGQGRQDEAIPLLIKSSELSPGYLADRYLLLSIYASRKESDKVKQLARQILQINPNDAEALKYVLPIQEVMRLAAKSPTPENYLTLSQDYFNQGLYQDCIYAAEQALKLRPNYAEAYNNIGAAYNTMQQWDKGISALNKALAIKPNFQLAINNLAWAKWSKRQKPRP